MPDDESRSGELAINAASFEKVKTELIVKFPGLYIAVANGEIISKDDKYYAGTLEEVIGYAYEVTGHAYKVSPGDYISIFVIPQTVRA